MIVDIPAGDVRLVAEFLDLALSVRRGRRVPLPRVRELVSTRRSAEWPPPGPG